MSVKRLENPLTLIQIPYPFWGKNTMSNPVKGFTAVAAELPKMRMAKRQRVAKKVAASIQKRQASIASIDKRINAVYVAFTKPSNTFTSSQLRKIKASLARLQAGLTKARRSTYRDYSAALMTGLPTKAASSQLDSLAILSSKTSQLMLTARASLTAEEDMDLDSDLPEDDIVELDGVEEVDPVDASRKARNRKAEEITTPESGEDSASDLTPDFPEEDPEAEDVSEIPETVTSKKRKCAEDDLEVVTEDGSEDMVDLTDEDITALDDGDLESPDLSEDFPEGEVEQNPTVASRRRASATRKASNSSVTLDSLISQLVMN